MSLKIVSSAPAKTILHGEHAVVFGKNAMAVSVDLRTTVTIHLDESNDKIILNSLDFNKTFSWSPSELNEVNYVTQDIDGNIPLYNESEIVKLNLLLDKFKCDNHFALETAKCFLFIYLNVSNIFNKSKPIPFITTISSELPVGAGMGSSASFSVSLTGGIMKAFGVPNLTKELVCRLSFECEKLFHGKPSGIDNSICTYGGAILFKQGKIIEKLDKLSGFEILLVYTKVSRNTKQLVSKISLRRERFPSIVEKIIESIDYISSTQWEQIKNCEKDFDKIEELVQINQDLLNSMGAGHPAIDDIVKTASKYNLSAKLSGAGGGGTVFVLLNPNLKKENLDKLLDELTKKGYEFWKVKSGSEGLSLEVIEEQRKKIF